MWPVLVSPTMAVRRHLAAGLTGVAVAVVVGGVWVSVLAPPPGSPLRPFLAILVAVPTVVVVAAGTAALAVARFGKGDDGSGAVTARRRAGGASLVASALGFCTVATAASLALDLPGFVALAAGFGAGAAVALALAVWVYDAVSPAGESVFAAGRFGEFATVLTAGAAGVVAMLVVGMVTTLLLVREFGHAPAIPLLSIPVGVGGGGVVALATVAVLWRHVRSPSPGEPDS